MTPIDFVDFLGRFDFFWKVIEIWKKHDFNIFFRKII